MLDLDVIDVEEIATALADQTDYEHRWLIDPRTGEVVFWTSDTGIDGENPVEIDELDLILIDPLPSYVWYQDMVDFAEGISDRAAGRRLSRSLQGKGAFRRFKNELYQRHPELISAWQAMRDARARVAGRPVAGGRRTRRGSRRSAVHQRRPGTRPPLKATARKDNRQVPPVWGASTSRRCQRAAKVASPSPSVEHGATKWQATTKGYPTLPRAPKMDRWLSARSGPPRPREGSTGSR